MPRTGGGPQADVNPEENRRLNVREVREGKTHLASRPISMNIELTGHCNVQPPCVFCTGRSRGYHYPALDYSPVEEYGEFITRAETVTDCSLGEPLTHRGLIDVARDIIATGGKFVFTTNGLLLDRAKADALVACGPRVWMNVSVNATTPETYYKLTGRDFNTVVENVRYYLAAFRERHGRPPPGVTLSMLVMRLNRGEVPDFLRLAGSLGTRVALAPLFDQPSPTRSDFGYHFVYREEMLPYDDLLDLGESAKTLAAELGIDLAMQWDSQTDNAVASLSEPGVEIPCLFPWRYLLVRQHVHAVLACAYHTQAIGYLSRRRLQRMWNSRAIARLGRALLRGDVSIDAVLRRSLGTIWNGRAMKRLRRSLLEGRIPQFCWEHNDACPLIAEMRHKRPRG